MLQGFDTETRYIEKHTSQNWQLRNSPGQTPSGLLSILNAYFSVAPLQLDYDLGYWVFPEVECKPYILTEFPSPIIRLGAPVMMMRRLQLTAELMIMQINFLRSALRRPHIGRQWERAKREETDEIAVEHVFGRGLLGPLLLRPDLLMV